MLYSRAMSVCVCVCVVCVCLFIHELKGYCNSAHHLVIHRVSFELSFCRCGTHTYTHTYGVVVVRALLVSQVC